MSDEGSSLVEAVEQRLPLLRGCRLLAIDGPAGSGKTTLAAEVETAARAGGSTVTTVHMDDVYDDWTGLDADLERRILVQVLRPLAAGRPARWQQYDWHAQRFDRWHVFEPPKLLILEGCGSGAHAYAEYISLLVWLEAPRDTRIVRGVERDGRDVLPHWLAWMSLEESYFVANRTRDRADVVLTTG